MNRLYIIFAVLIISSFIFSSCSSKSDKSDDDTQSSETSSEIVSEDTELSTEAETIPPEPTPLNLLRVKITEGKITCPYSIWGDEEEFIRIYADECRNGRDKIEKLKWYSGFSWDFGCNISSRIYNISYTDGTSEDVSILYTEDSTSTLIDISSGRAKLRERYYWEAFKSNPATEQIFKKWQTYEDYLNISVSDGIQQVNIAEQIGYDWDIRNNILYSDDYIIYLSSKTDYVYSVDRDVYDGYFSDIKLDVFDTHTGKKYGDSIFLDRYDKSKYIINAINALSVTDNGVLCILSINDKQVMDSITGNLIYNIELSDNSKGIDAQQTIEYRKSSDVDIYAEAKELNYDSDDGIYTVLYNDAGDLCIRDNKSGTEKVIFDTIPNMDEFTDTTEPSIDRYRSAGEFYWDGHKLWYSTYGWENCIGTSIYDAENGKTTENGNSFSIGFITKNYIYGGTSVYSDKWIIGRFPKENPNKIETLFENPDNTAIYMMPDGNILTVEGAGGSAQFIDRQIRCQINIHDSESFEIKKNYFIEGITGNSYVPSFATDVLWLSSGDYAYIIRGES